MDAVKYLSKTLPDLKLKTTLVHLTEAEWSLLRQVASIEGTSTRRIAEALVKYGLERYCAHANGAVDAEFKPLSAPSAVTAE